jgi:hypothetical protein
MESKRGQVHLFAIENGAKYRTLSARKNRRQNSGDRIVGWATRFAHAINVTYLKTAWAAKLHHPT